MKTKLSVLLALFLCVSIRSAAQTNETTRFVHRLDSIGMARFLAGQYSESNDVLEKAVEILDNDKSYSPDSSLVKLLLIIGKNYYRLRKWDRAADAALRYTKIYGETVSDADLTYAHYADNAALYLLNVPKAEESRRLNARAIEIYEKLSPVSADMAIAYSHAGDSYRESDIRKTIEFQKKSLDVWGRVEGVYSERYKDELSYLKAYAEEAGDEFLAKTTKTRISLLESGGVPSVNEVKDADDARRRTEEMLYACRYFKSHYLGADNMVKTAQFINSWIAASEDVLAVIYPSVARVLDSQKRIMLMVAYLAGVADCCITDGEDGKSLKAYAEGMASMLNCYNHNKKQVGGESAALDTYIDVYDKNRDSFFEMLRKDYDEAKTVAKEDVGAEDKKEGN